MPPQNLPQKNVQATPPTTGTEKKPEQCCPWCEAPIPSIGADGKISDADKLSYHRRCWAYFTMLMERFGADTTE